MRDQEMGVVQLLAAVSARRSIQGSWPYGLSVNHKNKTVIEVRERGQEAKFIHYLYVARTDENC